MKIDSKTLKIPKGQIYYEVSKGKQPILFLHGSNNNLTIFNEYRDFFRKKGFGTIAMDLRGDGKSSGSDNSGFYKLTNYISDIEKILEQEKIKQVSIVGFSIGGLIAQEFASKNPKKTNKLVLISSTYNVEETFCTTKLRKSFFEFSTELKKVFISLNKLKQKITGSNSKFYPIYNSKEIKNSSDLGYLFKFFLRHQNNYLERTLKFSDNSRYWNIKKDLERIICPTLIIQGEKDKLIPMKTAYKLNELIKSSEAPIIIKNSGHSMIYKKPEEIIPHIYDFLLE